MLLPAAVRRIRAPRSAAPGVVALVAVLACGGAVVALPAPESARPAAQSGGERQSGVAFGYRLGEERRYALGPPEALRPGEGDLWIMRLEAIDDLDAERRVRFKLEHESRRYARLPNPFAADDLIVFRESIDLTVNDHGFPLDIHYVGELDDAVAQNDHEEVTLTFADGRFAVSNRFSMQYRRYNLGVPSSSLADPDVPRGVYVSGSEHPALYGLIVAGGGEEIGDVEYLALRPSSLAARRQRVFGKPSWRDSLPNARLRFEGRTTVDIGGVTEEALRLRRPGGARPDIYVRADGTVLRVDTSTAIRHSAYIRLLRPSEY